ncbi:DUF1801 domain-containing protein [Indibacter alkaliphilus LW1]|uniref:DUF1801 domain-containing protein n=1 Tax=Indibacter alkaliphilus (strain CCUG 57479 / KCTC 22604 / LW1) TaxID=1189612 RepID=S2D0F6_INDAL|nr:DUF1801 domain-containing protein [Indibacter alkaliphilus]EOZ92852.1 DUF1801 domain-containing protein [Indibacter alkaliphilus LW1]
MKLNPKVDKYLVDGCMRCKYGGTPQCKVLPWVKELEMLRQIVLETGLAEEIKWGVPVYTMNGKNIVTVNALKDSANIGFFKGALLKDDHQILEQQGNIQEARLIRFSDKTKIENLKDILKAYILEAIAIENSGKKVETVKNPEPLPEELLNAFKEDPSFEKAFFSLTQGRQRGYIIHFTQAKQVKTRISRIEKYKQKIKGGIGLHDRY